MYKLHLILKYLRKRRIAWVSLIAVMLCTAMVIVVISVMGGWLRMFKETFHDITGDIVVSRRSLTGFPYYQEMMEEIEKLPEVAGAAPTLKTFGLINIENKLRDGVQVVGLDLAKMQKIGGFRKSLYRQYELPLTMSGDKKYSEAERTELLAATQQPASFDLPYRDEYYKRSHPDLKGDIGKWPGMIVGAGVVGIGKTSDGKMDRPENLYSYWIHLTVLKTSEDMLSLDTSAAPPSKRYWIVDDSRTKVWQYDSSTVYVPFDVLQKDLGMDAQKYTDADTKEEKIDPARTSDIRVGLKPDADLFATRDKIAKIVDDVLVRHNVTSAGLSEVRVETWLENNAKFIGAVEKEKSLVTFLFGMISIVAVFLIFCIFYMIVVEKTKDIGIIKSVGATNGGVAAIFLGYGLAIGLVGSLLGLLAGYLIVHNINELHTAMGDFTNWLYGTREQIWNPEVYAFDTIPNTVNPPEVIVIMAVAVLSSVIGALVPAWRAARLHPVEALRWE